MPVLRERTKDIYEQIPGYPKPPLIPLPGPDDVEALERDLTGAKGQGLRFKVLHAVLVATGFRTFHERLSNEELERLLRRTDLRRLGQPAPVISATVNLADDPRELSVLERAASLLLGARQLCRELRAGTFPQDTHGGAPLEMGQYPNLFSTSLVWEGGRKPRIFKSTETSRINLAVGRRLYSLDIGDLDSDPSTESLLKSLSEVAERSKCRPLGAEEPSLGLLSNAKPRTQRIAFPLLEKKRENKNTFEALRHGFLTLCLDLDHRPESDAEAAQMAHAGNPCNRWHQSSLQLVVFGNGKACAIFKFDACIDGNTMMRGAAEIQKRAANLEMTPGPDPEGGDVPPAKELVCRMNTALARRAWRDARSVLDSQRATFEITQAGKSFFQAHGIDAVPAFVLALQMTIVHFTGRPGRVEQLLTMSKYRCMGLSTVMVSTPETVRFTEYMTNTEVQKEKARTMMASAIDSQKRECRRARSDLPFSQLIPLFLKSSTGWKRRFSGMVFAATRLVLGIKWSSDVALSHPAIFPEATMLGRPGVRLPYVKYFGLHYRMQDESILLTMMPSLYWTIPNEEFISVLEDKLLRIKDLVRGEA